MARRSEYNQDTATQLCQYLSEGESLRTATTHKGMPSAATVFSWMRTNPEFLKQYEKAKQESTDAMAEEIMDIADNGANDWMEKHYGDNVVWVTNGEALQRSRLRVDVRKWLMSKMKPKKYGESLDVTSDHKPIPLLHAIHNNNSDPKDTGAAQKA